MSPPDLKQKESESEGRREREGDRKKQEGRREGSVFGCERYLYGHESKRPCRSSG